MTTEELATLEELNHNASLAEAKEEPPAGTLKGVPRSAQGPKDQQ
jgi:hypothetical protein